MKMKISGRGYFVLFVKFRAKQTASSVDRAKRTDIRTCLLSEIRQLG